MNHLRIANNLTLPPETVTETFAILAKRGVGKTHTAVVITEEILRAGQQVVVCDPVGVWWGLRSSKDGKTAGLSIIILGGDHADSPLDVAAGQAVADLIVDERISVVVDLSRFRKGEQTRFMTDFCERLYQRNRQPLHLMMDEADAFAPQRPMKGEERLLGAVEDLVRRGRARGLGITLVTQRSAVLNKNVLSQVEVLVALRTIAPQDREAIDAWINVHGTLEQRKELMGSLPSLPIGEAWFWSPGWLDLFRRVKVRDRTTFDSSATPKVGQTRQQPKQFAEIDLSRLRDRFAAVIEKAKADDPQILRKRIAELERQLKAKPAAAVDQAAIDRARNEGIRESAKLFNESEQKYMAIIADLQGRLRAIVEAVGDIGSLPSLEAKLPTAKPQLRNFATLKPQLVKPARSAQTTPSAELSKGEQIVLTVVGQYPDGATREQITILTGYKRSTRDAYLQRLRGRGLIEDKGQGIVATEAGMTALGDEFEHLPTGTELQHYWIDRLPAGESQILGILLEAYPKSVDREQISEATGYAKSSRDAYLQRLAARKLIANVGRGEVRAAETFFE